MNALTQPTPSSLGTTHVVTLLSAGLHPTSSRSRRADQDSRALEMALTLADKTRIQLTPLHAGSTEEPALRQYAGMGLSSLTVLTQKADDDALITLTQHLLKHPADLILCGVRAESGESSGLLPYLLAQKLAYPIVNNVADILAMDDQTVEVLQALPRGQRRKVQVRRPCVLTIDSAAPAPRQSAFGPGQRTGFVLETIGTQPDQERASWTITEAKPRPKRMKKVKAKTAADRFKAATAKSQSSGGQIIKDQSPEAMATTLVDRLVQEGVL
jgi:electron transfer flavoprotein beta subunit